MVETKIRGISLMSALLLITMVMLIAATMAGVFTLNVNITNRVSNSSVALSEAEAGLAEVLYQITRDENIEGDGNQENPKITWGLNGETVQGTITPGMQPDEAYHVVTFDTSSSYPYSTNNTTLDNDSGYDGRVVPDGMLHIISTGYCKGQYRTIECVVEKPPFPFGLATSGLIDSETPMRVLGTSSLAGYTPGEEDRPGHLLCNSPEGVTIGTKDGFETEISGFVKSAGQVSIEQPAVVRGGVQSFAEETKLIDIDIQDFNLAGQPGVVTLLDNTYNEDQELDVMYQYSGPGLHYGGDVELQQAMLFIDGSLQIDGELSGEGLIIVTGDVTLNSGTELRGTDKMALIAGGSITVDGEVDSSGKSNYFSGLVYTEGNLIAKNITIVGNAVVNSSDPGKGNAILENTTMISNEETGDMTIIITSSTKAKGSQAGGEGVGAPPVGSMLADGQTGVPETVGYQDWDTGNQNGYVDGTQDKQGLKNSMKNDLWNWASAGEGFPEIQTPAYINPDAAALWGQFTALMSIPEAYHDVVAAYEAQKAKVEGMDDDDPDKASEEDKLDDLAEAKAAAEATQDEFNNAVDAYVDAVFDYVGSYTDASGSFEDGIHEMDITRTERFNLNEYLPQSERVKMSFWKVYPRRM